MGKSIMRIGDPLIPHPQWTPHVLATGASTVKLNGKPIVRINDLTTIHRSGKSSHSSYQATGSSTVKIQGSYVARTGDKIACGSIDDRGSPNGTAG